MCERVLVEKPWVKQMFRAGPQGVVGLISPATASSTPQPPFGHHINTELIEIKTRWVVFTRLNLHGS